MWCRWERGLLLLLLLLLQGGVPGWAEAQARHVKRCCTNMRGGPAGPEAAERAQAARAGTDGRRCGGTGHRIVSQQRSLQRGSTGGGAGDSLHCRQPVVYQPLSIKANGSTVSVCTFSTGGWGGQARHQVLPPTDSVNEVVSHVCLGQASTPRHVPRGPTPRPARPHPVPSTLKDPIDRYYSRHEPILRSLPASIYKTV